MNVAELKEEIEELKKSTNSIILSHYYQELDVQSIGDFLGDSLGLSRKAASVKNAEHIVFAAVDFMAEVAKMLNPTKNVLLPDPTASCPMANQLTGEEVRTYKKKYPKLPAVIYINTLAEAKAECDVVCTSANSVKVCTAIAEEWGVDKILMGPDKNLSHFVQTETGLEVVIMPEKGCCYVHDQFIVEDANMQTQRYPDADVIVHPECKPEIQDLADFIGSTSQMIKYVENSSEKKEFIIGTEQGMIDYLQNKHPDLKLHSLSPTGVFCRNMKKTTLEKVRNLFLKIQDGEFGNHSMTLDPAIAKKAKEAIDKMFDYT